MFERPEYAVRGKRPYDQRWIDGNVEAGVGACGWQRPKPRPASFDAPTRGAAPVRPKQRSLLGRVKARLKAVIRRPAPQPAPAQAAPAPVREPPRPPRSDLDELLDPGQ